MDEKKIIIESALVGAFLGNSFPHAKELVFKDLKEGRRMQVLAKRRSKKVVKRK